MREEAGKRSSINTFCNSIATFSSQSSLRLAKSFFVFFSFSFSLSAGELGKYLEGTPHALVSRVTISDQAASLECSTRRRVSTKNTKARAPARARFALDRYYSMHCCKGAPGASFPAPVRLPSRGRYTRRTRKALPNRNQRVERRGALSSGAKELPAETLSCTSNGVKNELA